jgi:hypothetical protein
MKMLGPKSFEGRGVSASRNLRELKHPKQVAVQLQSSDLAASAVAAMDDDGLDQCPYGTARRTRLPRCQMLLQFGDGGAVDRLVICGQAHDRSFRQAAEFLRQSFFLSL